MSEMIKLNYDSKIKAITSEIISWNNRHLTTLGRITVVKTLLISKLTHLFMSLPTPEESMIKRIESILFKFIWQDKPEKIARNRLIQDYENGGLRMVHIRHFIKSLKLTWFKRIFHNKSSWIDLLYECMPNNFSNFTKLGDFNIKLLSDKTSNCFWKDVFVSLYDLMSHFKTDNTLFEPIWYNDKVKIDDQPVFYKNWFSAGVMYVYDFVDENGIILNYERFCKRFNFKPPFTHFYGIQEAVKKLYNIIDHEFFVVSQPYRRKYLEVLMRNIKGSSHFYDIFIQSTKFCTNNETKWELDINMTKDKVWWKACNHASTHFRKDVRLIWFQYRIIHRILATNVLLKKIGIVESDMCSFCRESIETLKHLFWYCSRVRQFWIDFSRWLSIATNSNVTFNIDDVIFGKLDTNKNKTLNLLLCLAKQHIYKQRLKLCTPSIDGVKYDIKSYMDTEKYMYQVNDNLEVYKKCWGNYLKLNP